MSEDVKTPVATGGAGGFSSIDPANEKDRALVRQATQRWPRRWRGINEAAKESFAAGLVEANEAARNILKTAEDTDEATKAANVIASIARTAAMIEKQNQDDEHLADKNARLDAGLATERTAIEPVIIRSAFQRPTPEAEG